MKTFDDEGYVLKNYRLIPSRKIKYIGNYFRCYKIEKLTKSILFSKSWINSSSKDVSPPDFHNDRHHIMMEMMRIDDCVNNLNGEHVKNSFERESDILKSGLGKDYKKNHQNDIAIIFPDTSNTDEFNYSSYFDNFVRTIYKHSSKIEKYKENYPKCKEVIFFLLDESNEYIQTTDNNIYNETINANINPQRFVIHYCYLDKKFLDVIKTCRADYFIWMSLKGPFVNNKRIKYPLAVIYDIKHMNYDGIEYNEKLMLKIKD